MKDKKFANREITINTYSKNLRSTTTDVDDIEKEINNIKKNIEIKKSAFMDQKR